MEVGENSKASSLKENAIRCCNPNNSDSRRFWDPQLDLWDDQGYIHSRTLRWKPKKGPIKTTVLPKGDYLVSMLVWGSVQAV